MAGIGVAVSGVTGRMGRTLVRLIAEAEDLVLVGGVASHARSGDDAASLGCDRVHAPADAAELVGSADVVIDFSTPDGLMALLDGARGALAGRALVCGTTGLDAAAQRRLDELAAEAAVFVASNFSAGVHVLGRLVERAARSLGAAGYDIEIVESHHAGKADAPSGTALSLGEAAARGRAAPLQQVRRDGRSGAVGARPRGEIGFHAIRGGGVIGEHSVQFIGARERIELSHVALDRALFAAGALDAARWAARRAPGRYGMADMLPDEER
jgi:4-hydroxy-tetrahydrodipicolinate reductase